MIGEGVLIANHAYTMPSPLPHSSHSPHTYIHTRPHPSHLPSPLTLTHSLTHSLTLTLTLTLRSFKR